MIIQRTIKQNGTKIKIKIKLNEQELYKAYEEQEHIYDKDSIRNNITNEEYLDPELYKKLKNKETFIDTAAYELRRNLDKYNMEYSYAVKEAIASTIKDEYM